MTSTEIERFQQRPVTSAHRDILAESITDSWVLVVRDVAELADHICRTQFVPANYRNNAPAVAAAILAGRELGLPPMTALRHVHVVEGSPSLSAEYKRARVLAVGHDFDILELSTTRCRVSGSRKGSGKPPLEITYTIEDARRANLVKPKGAWETRPRRMLFARASTELCDFLFADITNGLPTAELVAEGDSDDEFSGYNESPGQAAPKTAAEQPERPRTAQRRTRQAVAVPATSAPAGTAPATAARSDSQPPLPGEEDETSSAPKRASDPGTAADPDFDPAAPGTASVGKGGQLTALWTCLKADFGFTDDDKDQARGVCEQVIGRDLGGTTGNLSYNEAKTCLDTLANWRATAQARGEQPRDVMIAELTALGGEPGA